MKNQITILAMDHFFDSVIEQFSHSLKVVYPNELQNNINLIEGIITTPWTKVNADLINDIPNLKIISCFGTGIDSVDKNAAISRNIVITNTPDVVTEDTADIAMALLMCLSRNIVLNDKYTRLGNWKNSPAPLATSITGKTLGVLGFGKIGKRIADRALAFGMNVVYHSRTKKNNPYPYFENLIEMAKITNFLVVCCPGGTETRDIINLNILKALDQKGFLINVSRGSTVNESDLIYALENKIIAGAGLDVYSNEPNVPAQLIEMDNVILSPHVGTATNETRQTMLMLTMNNIVSFFKMGKSLNPVDL